MSNHNYVVHPIPGYSLWGHRLRLGYCKRCGEPVHPGNDVARLRSIISGQSSEGQPSEHFLPIRPSNGAMPCSGSFLKVCLERDLPGLPRYAQRVRDAHEQLLIEEGEEDWPKWTAIAVVALRKGDIKAAAHLLSMCWAPGPGEKMTYEWVANDHAKCVALFTHPLVIQHASQIWQFIKDWYEPDTLWWYEAFARKRGWKV